MDTILQLLKTTKDPQLSLELLSQLASSVNACQLSSTLSAWSKGSLSPPEESKRLEELEKIIGSPTVSKEEEEKARRAAIGYIQPLPVEDFVELQPTLPEGEWAALNPSIIPHEEGYLAIVRAVNYRIDNAVYTIYHPERRIVTRNFLLLLDPEFQVQQQWEVVDETTRPKFLHSAVGLEDCRLLTHQGRVAFTCTTLDRLPIQLPQISLAFLPDDWKSLNERIPILSLHQLESPFGQESRMEKNWLPFESSSGDIHAFYQYSPLTTLQIFPNTTPERVAETPIDYNTSKYKGSASPIPFREGKLLVVHETLWLSSRKPIYTHRWMYLADNGRIAISHQWYLEHLGIEFVSGCCWQNLPPAEKEQENKRIILTAGIDDREAKLYLVDPEKVASSLFWVGNGQLEESIAHCQ